jgi:uncharacterized membrane protein YhdT
MRNSVYTEKQSFWTWWLILLFVIMWMMQLQSIYVSDWKIDNSNYVELGILLCVFLFLAFVRLHTKIDEKGISIKFFPFVRKKTWLWEDIDDLYIKEYSITDYGGWGYRVGKNGTAYNTKGKYGLQLLLKNGARLMIGTQNHEELQHIIETFRKTKS